MSACLVCGDNSFHTGIDLVHKGLNHIVDLSYVLSIIREFKDENFYLCYKCGQSVSYYDAELIESAISEILKLSEKFVLLGDEIDTIKIYHSTYIMNMKNISDDERYRRFRVLHKFALKNLHKHIETLTSSIYNNITELVYKAFENEVYIAKMKKSGIVTYTALSKITKVNPQKVSKLCSYMDFDHSKINNLNQSIRYINENRYKKIS